MKVKNLCLLAGAIAALVVSSSALAQPEFPFSWTSTGSGPTVDNLKLVPTMSTTVLFGITLNTLTISVEGIATPPLTGYLTLGISSDANHPFVMQTANGFYNSDGFGSGQPFAATPATGDPLSLDSGFLGPNFTGFTCDWGAPSPDLTSWAMNGSNTSTGSGTWIDPDGVGAPGNSIDILRATWDASTHAEGAFLFVLAQPYPLAGDGTAEVYFEWTTIPAPGVLALLGLAGLVGARRRRA